ncbi:MAG TPA: YraN family protein [Fimbriimonadaceae bacterium]|nr:YraN family protein [Fimbriimonadaceae bacterium]HRJ33127.1 YraN family protein [Fimbriimonadaceae bacterium]
MPDRPRLGSAAELRAAQHLQAQGYTLVHRGFKAGRGEIDLIALDGSIIVFVEVKERLKSAQTPEEALTRDKQTRLVDAARHYLAQVGLPEAECRFDLIAIDRSGLRHYRQAFDP